MGIEKDIHDLLVDNDCVIVPGFGGFITHHRSARLDLARNIIHPPTKDLSFNRKLTRNDGLLADRVAHRIANGHEQALASISEQALAWSTSIGREGRVELTGIGTFFHDRERNLQFEPGRSSNFLKDAYGLRPVPAIPVATPRSANVPGPIVRELVRPSVDGERRVPVLWAAAAITAVLFGAGAWLTWREVGSGQAQWSGIGLFAPNDPPAYAELGGRPTLIEHELEAPDWIPPTDVNGIHRFPIAGADGPMVAVDLGSPELAAAESTAVAATSPAHSADDVRYHVIGGCFSIEENAERLVADLRARGTEAAVLDLHRGLHRVAVGSYADRSIALEALAAARKQGFADAWLLIK